MERNAHLSLPSFLPNLQRGFAGCTCHLLLRTTLGERPNAKTAESSDEEEVEVEVKISNSEALALIESLKKFYMQKDESSSNLLALDRMKRDVITQTKYTQSTMERFFL